MLQVDQIIAACLGTVSRFKYVKFEGRVDELVNAEPFEIEMVTPGNCTMPSSFKKLHQRYHDFEVHPDDVWVVTYPKAGTTWTLEMVWCILNKLNFKGEEEHLLLERAPFFEWDAIIPTELPVFSELPDDNPSKPEFIWKRLHSMERPRLIKSHFPAEILPTQIWDKKPRLIYVCRDPRDVCVSFFYHYKKLMGFHRNFDTFVEIFLGGACFFGAYWSHVLSFWKRRNEENVLFIRYEEMKENLVSVTKKVTQFLDVHLSEEEVEVLMDHISFDKMKNNYSANNEAIPSVTPGDEKRMIKFLRKGQVGDWKNHFTKEHVEMFEKWTQENLENSDFPYYRNYS